MEISVEISYYPLTERYNEIIEEFIEQLKPTGDISVTISQMSTLIKGSYSDVMNLLLNSMKPFLEKYPSVFTLKIANACNANCAF